MIYLISSIIIIVTLLVYTIVNIKRELEEAKITKRIQLQQKDGSN